MPNQPLLTGVVSFLSHISAIARWLLLTLAVSVAAVLVISAIALSSGGPIAQFGTVACLGCLGIVILPTLAYFAACCVAIVVDSANGADEITSWPELDFLVWLPRSFFVVDAVVYSGAPGLAWFWLLSLFGAPDWLRLSGEAISLFVLFPIVLLSMLDNNSLVNPFSRPVWESLSISRRHWMVFFGEAALLVGAAALGGWFFAWCGQSTLLLAAAWLVVLVMVYCRLLGRLVWACQQPASFQRIKAL
jgi:hypothetical protein